MGRALKFILFWLGTWVAYSLIYEAYYIYDSMKYDMDHPFTHRSHGPLGLPHLWELVLVAIASGVGAFLTALKFIDSDRYAKRGSKP